MRRAAKRVVLCDEIVEVPGGLRYTCGRHTKNKTGKCSQHNRPAAAPARAAEREKATW